MSRLFTRVNYMSRQQAKRLERAKQLLKSIAIVGILAALGCSAEEKPKAPVNGTVTLNEKPVAGTITFQSPETGKVFTGELDAAGKFQIEDVEVGDYKVYVTPPEITEAPEGPQDIAKLKANQKSSIPAGYQNLTTTDLTATVEAGKENPYQFDLKPSGPSNGNASQPTPP